MREVVAPTALAESAAADIGETRKGTISTQLGDALNAKNLKVADVVKQWDQSGDGVVDRKEFRTKVLAMGVTSPETEIDAYFDRLDKVSATATVVTADLDFHCADQALRFTPQ